MSTQDPKPKTLDLSDVNAALALLQDATQKAVAISDRSVGQTHTGRQRRTLAVFAKLIVHDMAIMGLATDYLGKPGPDVLLDHFSMAVLGRAAIDAALMTMYISEPGLSLDNWDFRRQLLFLHDANNRSRFLKPAAKEGIRLGFFDTYKDVKDGIVKRISELGGALLLSETQIEEYQKGLYLFVDGARGAAREAGWDLRHFDFDQSYLSAYVHSHPVSFMRFDEHDIAFGGASLFQLEFCEYVFQAAARYTNSVVERMEAFSVPETGDPNGHLE